MSNFTDDTYPDIFIYFNIWKQKYYIKAAAKYNTEYLDHSLWMCICLTIFHFSKVLAVCTYILKESRKIPHPIMERNITGSPGKSPHSSFTFSSHLILYKLNKSVALTLLKANQSWLQKVICFIPLTLPSHIWLTVSDVKTNLTFLKYQNSRKTF